MRQRRQSACAHLPRSAMHPYYSVLRAPIVAPFFLLLASSMVSGGDGVYHTSIARTVGVTVCASAWVSSPPLPYFSPLSFEKG